MTKPGATNVPGSNGHRPDTEAGELSEDLEMSQFDLQGSSVVEDGAVDSDIDLVTDESETAIVEDVEQEDLSVDDDGDAEAYALAGSDDALGDISDLDSRRLDELEVDGSDPVRTYLREIGSTPLLSADQELRTCATFTAASLLFETRRSKLDIFPSIYDHMVASCMFMASSNTFFS